MFLAAGSLSSEKSLDAHLSSELAAYSNSTPFLSLSQRSMDYGTANNATKDGTAENLTRSTHYLTIIYRWKNSMYIYI